MMSTVMVVFCVMPPPVAVMVIAWFPVDALLLALTVKVALPLPSAITDGEKVTVSPLPCPEADRVIAESKLPERLTTTVDVPELLRATDNDWAEAEREKVGDVAAGARALISPVPFGVPQPVTRS